MVHKPQNLCVQPIRKLTETLLEIDFSFKSGCANQKLREVFWGRMGMLSAGFFNKTIAGVKTKIFALEIVHNFCHTLPPKQDGALKMQKVSDIFISFYTVAKISANLLSVTAHIS